jgi:general secretion pathway protein C
MPAGALTLPTLSHRIAALSPRERIFLGVGAAALLVFLFSLLMPSGEEPGVELGSPPTSASVAPPPPPPVMATPVVTVPPPAPPAAPAADPAALGGLILRGVSGGGPSGGAAIFALGDGAQRVVRVGREIVPGIRLREVGLNHAIASAAGGDIRLELNKAGGVALAPSAAAPAAAPVAAPSAAPASQQRETMRYRLGLQPMKSGGRISGYQIKPGAQLPQLASAGLRPGDIILGVNGSQLGEEQLMELSWTIANSNSTEFEFIRNGKRMKVALNPTQAAR